MAADGIRTAIQAASAHLAQHPEQARSTDTPQQPIWLMASLCAGPGRTARRLALKPTLTTPESAQTTR
jgi:hypothetical protein